MSDQPPAEELLRRARATLLEELLPALPSELHYPARMIANAMAIAARELEGREAREREALARLAGFYREPGGEPGSERASEQGPDANPATRRIRLEALERRLAEDIRTGRLDHREAALRRLLLDDVRARLHSSNPKRL